ncbi:ELYS domain-containing protein [Favolaschia claudopus]|uniref:ELYS domain-containing protein n=1 Tax=Favolaschia claudopus TaxID=2862362 RepID=A0AAW0D009_9AGAR
MTMSAAVLSYFDLSPDAFPWRDSRPQQIERRRAAMGDLLLFDILLTSGGIREPDTLYPPVDVPAFHRLFEAIQNSAYDALKRDCLVYFLLKWYQDGREERYKQEKCIPPQFASLSDAYWHLDAGINIPYAVSILSDARLVTDYASKILQAISLSPNSMPLVLKYVRTAKPLLTEPDDIDIYTIALAESSLSGAWAFQRTFNEQNETRPRLLRKILDWCFTSPPRRDALIQLLGIAFTSYEQNLIQSYATPPSNLPVAGVAILQNLLCVRLIQTGKYADAIKLDRQFSSASAGKLGPQTERTKMVQDLYAALPLAERSVLDLELENPSRQETTTNGMVMAESSGPTRDRDLGMSWEAIHPQPPAIVPSLPSAFTPSASSSVLKGTKANGLSKFGGFGASVGTPAASAFSPLAFSNSSSSHAPAPIIPVQNAPRGSPFANLPSSSARQSLNGSTNAFSSLSQSTSRFAGSPASSQFGSKSLFDSANKKQNAFYQPPPTSVPPPFPGFNEVAAAGSSRVSEDRDVEMELGEEHEQEAGRENDESAEDEGLAHSVFGGRPVRSSKRAGSKAKKAQVETKKAPPGAFDIGEEQEVDVPETNLPPPETSRKTRNSTATKASAKSAKLSKGPTTRTRGRAKEEPELSRSLPGSLMDSEDGSADEADEEEGDKLAPLPPSHAKAAAEGAQTRRRSSRLSSVSSEEGRADKEKPPGKTKATTGTGRKRRT